MSLNNSEQTIWFSFVYSPKLFLDLFIFVNLHYWYLFAYSYNLTNCIYKKLYLLCKCVYYYLNKNKQKISPCSAIRGLDFDPSFCRANEERGTLINFQRGSTIKGAGALSKKGGTIEGLTEGYINEY